MYALVQSGEVVQIGFRGFICPNGCAVSNPELLPSETLATYGFLPYTKSVPEYNEATQIPVFDHYEITEGVSVVGHYTIEVRPATLKESFNLLNGAFLDLCVNLPILIGV